MLVAIGFHDRAVLLRLLTLAAQIFPILFVLFIFFATLNSATTDSLMHDGSTNPETFTNYTTQDFALT